MKKRMYFNAFSMNCVTHMSPGLWTREDDHMVDYTALEHWTEFARLLERGCFDAIFLADVIGSYDTYAGNRDATSISGGHLPINDPMLLVPAMAAATEHLGFGLTSSIMQYHPFSFARLFSTLDHLSKGRVAWNIVTSFTQSAARNFELRDLPAHDERYEMAAEYCNLCYLLWEDSWADDAVVKDKRRGISEVSYVATLALISGWTGVDFSQYEPDQPVDYIETNVARTILHSFCATDSDRRWTLRDIAAYVGMGGVGPVLVGAPEQIADQLEAWTEVGVDGFNLSYSMLPNSYVDFIEGVVPVLQRRGHMQSSYRGGTLRQKLFERASSHMPLPHPAAAARRPW